MPTRIKKFSFPLREFDEGKFTIIEDEEERGVTETRWTPFAAESDPEANVVWVWAFAQKLL